MSDWREKIRYLSNIEGKLAVYSAQVLKLLIIVLKQTRSTKIKFIPIFIVVLIYFSLNPRHSVVPYQSLQTNRQLATTLSLYWRSEKGESLTLRYLKIMKLSQFHCIAFRWQMRWDKKKKRNQSSVMQAEGSYIILT